MERSTVITILAAVQRQSRASASMTISSYYDTCTWLTTLSDLRWIPMSLINVIIFGCSSLKLLQEAFVRWFIPGKDNAVDEAGLPSRFRWLRMYNKDKPNKYFIEILMACCSVTRFCWAFFINEKSEKKVLRRNRRLPPGRTTGRGQRQSKYEKVPYFQTEFDERTRSLQSEVGATTAQIYHFAKILRSFDNAPGHDRVVTYRLFMDRRWDSLYGHYLAMSEFGVSCTTTVAKGSRYHIANDDNFPTLKGDTKNLKKKREVHTEVPTQWWME